MQSYEVWGKLSISCSTLGVSANCVLLALQPLGLPEAVKPVNALQNRAKTAANIQGQKAIPRHELTHYILG